MIKKSTIFLIVSLILLILYHCYDLSTNNNKIIDNERVTINIPENLSESSESASESCINCNKNNIFKEETKKKKEKKVKTNNTLVKKIKKMQKKYGEPTETVKENGASIFSWEFLDNKPWNKIVYNYSHNFPYYYYIKAHINNLQEYQQWKEILPNLNFDPKRKSIVIQTKDETTALAVANIILSNLQGKIQLSEIIEKQLIPISINRAKKYTMVKNKLKEQLIENINGSTNNKDTNMLDYTEDLAPSKKDNNKKETNNGPIAGNELYSVSNTNSTPLAAMQVSGDTGFSFI